jgi:two-component sensor histidine kinase
VSILFGLAYLMNQLWYKSKKSADLEKIIDLRTSKLNIALNEKNTALNEKNVLLQEVHHRVKNNLAVISGLLHIQRFSSDDEKLNKALEASEMRIKSMALIHEKLYQAESLSEIDFKHYIEDLLIAILGTIGVDDHITASCNCDSMKLNVNQAMPCALIINELISNSIEHAFIEQKRGEVRIRLKEQDGRVCITLKDNGIGLPENFIKREMTSMGTTIINALLDQLEADFKAFNDNGAIIEFSFLKKDAKGSSSALI